MTDAPKAHGPGGNVHNGIPARTAARGFAEAGCRRGSKGNSISRHERKEHDRL